MEISQVTTIILAILYLLESLLNFDLKKKIKKLLQKNEKFEQALIRIKEIAEPFCNACQEIEPEKRNRNCVYCNYGSILQKISEVIK